MAIVVGTAGCSGSSKPATPSDIIPLQASSAATGGVGTSDLHVGQSSTELIVKSGCEAPCTVTGMVPLPHTKWGPGTLVTTGASDGVHPQVQNIFVLDATGTVQWRFKTDSWQFLRANTPVTDKTGHIFLEYNPGRYDGLVVLAMTSQGVDDFQSLPKSGDLVGRFYGGVTVDPHKTGTFQVLVSTNTCDPDCAAANYVDATFVWNGHDYIEHPGDPK
ncbi:MAG TPA: hypothetical protein VGJ07_19660 [Rugosimonospora sp.]